MRSYLVIIGSSKEVAKQIYKDLRKLEKEQSFYADNLKHDGDRNSDPKVHDENMFSCFPSFLSLRLARDEGILNIRRRWWRAKGKHLLFNIC